MSSRDEKDPGSVAHQPGPSNDDRAEEHDRRQRLEGSVGADESTPADLTAPLGITDLAPIWVAWRGEKHGDDVIVRVPYSANGRAIYHASSDKSTTWLTHEAAGTSGGRAAKPLRVGWGRTEPNRPRRRYVPDRG